MKFIKATVIVFLLHLVLVVTLGTIVAMGYDPNDNGCESSGVLWMLFYLIDFPFMWIYAVVCEQLFTVYPQLLPLHPLEFIPNHPFQDDRLNFYWHDVIMTGCEAQVVGWINWTIIWTIWMWFRRFRQAKSNHRSVSM